MRTRLTLLVALLGLLLPPLGHALRGDLAAAADKRSLFGRPDFPRARWQWQTLPPMFDAYAADHAGFRAERLALRRDILYGALNESFAPLVWAGRGGWLFGNAGGARHGFPAEQDAGLAEARLDAWAAHFRRTRAELDRRGALYVVLVARDKDAVYPEFLPAAQARHRVPDALSALRARLYGSGVEPIDLGPALRAAKGGEAEPLYFRDDSHWTDAGAWAGYAALAAELARLPGYRAKPRAAFRPTPWVYEGGDLRAALGYPRAACREPYTLFVEEPPRLRELPADDLPALLPPGRLRHVAPRRAECAAAPPLRALFLHDSFGSALGRLLASDFRHFASAGCYEAPAALFDAERPDVVVQLVVDRMFRARAPAE